MTLGVDFHLKAMEVDGELIKLQIWDFAGEERFRFLFPSYIRGANGAVFMYDITNYGSLAHVDDWFDAYDNSGTKGAYYNQELVEEIEDDDDLIW